MYQQCIMVIHCYYTLNEVVLYIKVRNHPLNELLYKMFYNCILCKFTTLISHKVSLIFHAGRTAKFGVCFNLAINSN